ncbi:MAG: hypothetical protein SF123_14765 [Chloroflexota bacterium]|nr:hypothetical protein [Chloroflexota bacterium]
MTAPSDAAINFLMQEYQSMYALHQQAKERGDERLNFYVTFAGALGSIVIAAQQFVGGAVGVWLMLAGVPIIILLGVLTFRRMLQRRVAIMIYRRRLARIRGWFLHYFPEIASGLPYAPEEKSRMEWGNGRLGSTAFAVATINTSIITFVVLFVCVNVVRDSGQAVLALIAVVGAALASWRLHLLWKTRWLRRAEREDNALLDELNRLTPSPQT